MTERETEQILYELQERAHRVLRDHLAHGTGCRCRLCLALNVLLPLSPDMLDKLGNDG